VMPDAQPCVQGHWSLRPVRMRNDGNQNQATKPSHPFFLSELR
jgi:hypothetical protein